MPQDKVIPEGRSGSDAGLGTPTLDDCGLYTQDSPAFHRGVLDDCSRCLKADTHDAGVICEVTNAPKLIGGIGERNFGRRWQPGNRVYDSDGVAATLTAQPCGRVAGYNAMYSVDVMVKEATKKGYAIARERGRRQPRDAEQQDKERTSRGSYGKYIRYELQSGYLCTDIRRT